MLIAATATLAISYLSTWFIRGIARRYGWVSGPRSERHIHKRPIPRLGGVAIFVSFIVVSGFSALLYPQWLPRTEFFKLLVPAAVMFAVGLWDDISPLRAKVKLVFQIGCGGALFLWIASLPIGVSVARYPFGSVLLLCGTISWVVLVSNSINLIDGVDGLAGGTAVLSLAAIACVAWRSNHDAIVFTAVLLIAAVLGFLRFNLNPASMFLGDGGSLFLGFMISALGLAWSNSQALATTISVAVAILALPLAETGVSVTRRFLSGRALFSPDREHMHHKLLDRGLSQKKVTWVLYSAAGTCGVAGIAMAIGGPTTYAIGLGFLLLVLTAGVVMLGYTEFREFGRIAIRVSEQRRVVANNVILRKLAHQIETSSCLGELGGELQTALFQMEFDGFELLLSPWVSVSAPCNTRVPMLRWGCSMETRTADGAYWRMGVDLLSEKHGKLGTLRLARRVQKGSLLFDANVVVTELQPAITAALERCLIHRCVTDLRPVQSGDVAWMIEPTSAVGEAVPIRRGSQLKQ